jgi:hypothetical protein
VTDQRWYDDDGRPVWHPSIDPEPEVEPTIPPPTPIRPVQAAYEPPSEPPTPITAPMTVPERLRWLVGRLRAGDVTIHGDIKQILRGEADE